MPKESVVGTLLSNLLGWGGDPELEMGAWRFLCSVVPVVVHPVMHEAVGRAGKAPGRHITVQGGRPGLASALAALQALMSRLRAPG